jgi:hypothetical protein
MCFYFENKYLHSFNNVAKIKENIFEAWGFQTGTACFSETLLFCSYVQCDSPDDGNSKYLRNVCQFLPEYAALRTPPWEREISRVVNIRKAC